MRISTKNQDSTKSIAWWALVVFFFFLTSNAFAEVNLVEISDPFENFNRVIYKLNDGIDKATLKPIAKTYQAYTPNFLQLGVSNFFNNIRDVITLANEVLQLKPNEAFNTTSRITLNTTVGLLGIFDVHSKAGGQRSYEDFGQTLGWYGVPSGPYIVLPILGPSNFRDTTGWVVDEVYPYAFDPISHIQDNPTYYSMIAGQTVDMRTGLLEDTDLRDQQFDPYAFMRDSYVQYRNHLIKDEYDALEAEDASKSNAAKQK
jgi:phospholipid-binding lipoprotein MlaA